MSGWGDDEGGGWGASGDGGGGAGFGGGGAEKKKSGCFNCGEDGHMSRECTKEKKAPRGCFKCGEQGHMKSDCPNEAKDGDRPKRGCFKCGEDGHNKADCPNAGEDQPRDQKCFKCKGDHMAADCELPDKCRNCNKEGHQTKDCDMPEKCRNCGLEGHMARDCTEPEKCRRCGEEGHKVAECSKEPETRKITRDDGTVAEIYVPKEMGEDKLFETGIQSGINFDKFDKIPVKTTGDDVPRPFRSFEEANLRKIILENIIKSGYKKPTPVQKHAIPIILKERDMMACAQTGSGKTAAFLLPIIHALLEDGVAPNAMDSPQCPQAVILAPTRELAVQIKDEARKFSKDSILKAVVCYGGTSTGYQLSVLFRGCNLLIATPGRLKDFVEKGKISFSQLRYLVLDEADRMLDMGFKEALEEIIGMGDMPDKMNRQTLMFSATFSEDVQLCAKDFMKPNYLFLTIGILGGANADVTQTFYEVEKFGKRDKLKEILDGVDPTERTLIFTETKRNADFLATFLSGEGKPTTSIHGDRLQREREEALADFKSGKMPIMVATAVGARGLDIPKVGHVINYDLPKETDEYVHRIGRTGRVGNIGKATSFFDPGSDGGIASVLVKKLSDANQEVPDFLANAGMCGGDGGSGGFGGTDIRGGAAAPAAADDDDW